MGAFRQGWRGLACAGAAMAAIASAAVQPIGPAGRAAPSARRFAPCRTVHGHDCVVDGDTVRIAAVSVRLADIDAPETHPSRCPEEAARGARATARLAELLSDGPFRLDAIDRDRDRYGRALRIFSRHGRSLGAVLVAERLARRWDGRRRGWCA